MTKTIPRRFPPKMRTGNPSKKNIAREVAPGAPSESQSQVIEQFSSLSMIAGPVVNPVMQKITPDHISKTLEMRQEQERADNKFRDSNGNFVAFYVILAALLIVGATYWFSEDNPDLYKAILTHAAALAAGITGGWGWANIKRK